MVTVEEVKWCGESLPMLLLRESSGAIGPTSIRGEGSGAIGPTSIRGGEGSGGDDSESLGFLGSASGTSSEHALCWNRSHRRHVPSLFTSNSTYLARHRG